MQDDGYDRGSEAEVPFPSAPPKAKKGGLPPLGAGKKTAVFVTQHTVEETIADDGDAGGGASKGHAATHVTFRETMPGVGEVDVYSSAVLNARDVRPSTEDGGPVAVAETAFYDLAAAAHVDDGFGFGEPDTAVGHCNVGSSYEI